MKRHKKPTPAAAANHSRATARPKSDDNTQNDTFAAMRLYDTRENLWRQVCRDIRIISIKHLDRGNLKALANCYVGPFFLRGCRIVQQAGQRAYCQLPHAQGRGGRWFPVVQVKDPDLDNRIKAAVLAAWEADGDN